MNRISIIEKIFIYIAQALLVCIIFLPLIFAFVSSVRPLEDVYKYVTPLSWETFIPKTFTLEAYKQIFTEFHFGIAVANSVFVTGITVILGVLFNAMAGFAFAKFNFKGKNILFFIVLLALMIPFELISINLYQMIIGFGWINTYLALIVPSIANGMVIFLFRQFYLGFPDYMIESAMIDGLSWPRIFMKIVLPNSIPICISGGFILFLTQWESFLWPVLVTRTPDMYTIQIALSSFQTEHAKIWNCIFAASIVAFVIPIAIILPLQKHFIQGITSTGTKE